MHDKHNYQLIVLLYGTLAIVKYTTNVFYFQIPRKPCMFLLLSELKKHTVLLEYKSKYRILTVAIIGIHTFLTPNL